MTGSTLSIPAARTGCSPSARRLAGPALLSCLAVLLGLACLAPACPAADRIVVGVNREGIVSYDPKDIGRQGKNIVRMWIRIDMAPEEIEEAVKARPQLAGLSHAKKLIFIDCAASTYTLHHRILYGASGAVLDQAELKAPAAELRKDPILEALAKDTCSR
jgi:hypothetical protein